jgi:hypothetical protein
MSYRRNPMTRSLIRPLIHRATIRRRTMSRHLLIRRAMNRPTSIRPTLILPSCRPTSRLNCHHQSWCRQQEPGLPVPARAPKQEQ